MVAPMSETLSSIQQQLTKALEKSSAASKAFEAASAKLNPLKEKAEEAKREVDSLIAQYQRMTDAGKRRIKRPPREDRPCKVCNFLTKPHHDKRGHRSQGKDKKPFTASELTSKGMERLR